MRTVQWNILARQDYKENINYLQEKWSDIESQKFIDKIFKIETIFSIGNVEFQNTDRAGIKRCVINKQISLFYSTKV